MKIIIDDINISSDGLNRLDAATEINYELENGPKEIMQNIAQTVKEMSSVKRE